MRKIEFVKAIATGNDFVIIENKRFSSSELVNFARNLCDRKYGIGSDGLLVAEDSKLADLKMRIFNPDGSEAEMCGNGVRCFMLWAYLRNLVKNTSCIETLAGLIEGEVKKNGVIKVNLKAGFDYISEIKLNFKGKQIKGDYIDIGVPHFVIEVRDIKKTNVKDLGRFIRFHKLFKPKGVNVDFIEFKKGRIYIRTYERGVEDETLACGTGCVAASLVLAKKLGYESKKFIVLPKSGEKLKVSYNFDGKKFKDVYLEGKAEILFHGNFYLKGR